MFLSNCLINVAYTKVQFELPSELLLIYEDMEIIRKNVYNYLPLIILIPLIINPTLSLIQREMKSSI